MFPQGIKQHLFIKVMRERLCITTYVLRTEHEVGRTSGVQNGLNQTPALAAEESTCTYI